MIARLKSRYTFLLIAFWIIFILMLSAGRSSAVSWAVAFSLEGNQLKARQLTTAPREIGWQEVPSRGEVAVVIVARTTHFGLGVRSKYSGSSALLVPAIAMNTVELESVHGYRPLDSNDRMVELVRGRYGANTSTLIDPYAAISEFLKTTSAEPWVSHLAAGGGGTKWSILPRGLTICILAYAGIGAAFWGICSAVARRKTNRDFEELRAQHERHSDSDSE